MDFKIEIYSVSQTEIIFLPNDQAHCNKTTILSTMRERKITRKAQWSLVFFIATPFFLEASIVFKKNGEKRFHCEFCSCCEYKELQRVWEYMMGGNEVRRRRGAKRRRVSLDFWLIPYSRYEPLDDGSDVSIYGGFGIFDRWYHSKCWSLRVGK